MSKKKIVVGNPADALGGLLNKLTRLERQEEETYRLVLYEDGSFVIERINEGANTTEFVEAGSVF